MKIKERFDKVKKAKEDFEEYHSRNGEDPKRVRKLLMIDGKRMPHSFDLFMKMDRGVQLIKK